VCIHRLRLWKRQCDSSALLAKHTDAKRIGLLQIFLAHLHLRSCLSGLGRSYRLKVFANDVKDEWHTIPTSAFSSQKSTDIGAFWDIIRKIMITVTHVLVGNDDTAVRGLGKDRCGQATFLKVL
jgi:hypothetical protein